MTNYTILILSLLFFILCQTLECEAQIDSRENNSLVLSDSSAMDTVSMIINFWKPEWNRRRTLKLVVGDRSNLKALDTKVLKGDITAIGKGILSIEGELVESERVLSFDRKSPFEAKKFLLPLGLTAITAGTLILVGTERIDGLGGTVFAVVVVIAAVPTAVYFVVKESIKSVLHLLGARMFKYSKYQKVLSYLTYGSASNKRDIRKQMRQLRAMVKK